MPKVQEEQDKEDKIIHAQTVMYRSILEKLKEKTHETSISEALSKAADYYIETH